MLRRFLSTLVAACLVASCAPAAAKPKKPAAKRAATSAKSKPRASSARKSQSTRARRSGPRRQMAPTPERYMEIQQALADKGYFNGSVNGVWGPECVDALKRFQQDQNLAPDGKLGALSIIALGLGPKRQLAGELSSAGTKVEDQQ